MSGTPTPSSPDAAWNFVAPSRSEAKSVGKLDGFGLVPPPTLWRTADPYGGEPNSHRSFQRGASRLLPPPAKDCSGLRLIAGSFLGGAFFFWFCSGVAPDCRWRKSRGRACRRQGAHLGDVGSRFWGAWGLRSCGGNSYLPVASIALGGGLRRASVNRTTGTPRRGQQGKRERGTKEKRARDNREHANVTTRSARTGQPGKHERDNRGNTNGVTWETRTGQQGKRERDNTEHANGTTGKTRTRQQRKREHDNRESANGTTRETQTGQQGKRERDNRENANGTTGKNADGTTRKPRAGQQGKRERDSRGNVNGAAG